MNEITKIYIAALATFALHVAAIPGAGAIESDAELSAPVNAVVVGPFETKETVPAAADELEFVVDLEEFRDAKGIDVSLEELKRMSGAMATEQNRELLSKVVLIPMSTENIEALESVSKLTDEQRASFLARKTRYLERIVKLLATFELKPSLINKVTSYLNEKIFGHAELLTQHRLTVGMVGIRLGTGVGLTPWLTAQLKKSRLFRHLPERSGFYYAVSFGIAVSRDSEAQTNRYRFLPVVEFRRGEKFNGGFAFASAGLFVGAGQENHEPDPIQRMRFFKISKVGFSSSSKVFGGGMSVLGAQLGTDAFAYVEGDATALALNRSGFDWLFQKIRDSFYRYDRRRTCRALFAGP